MARPAWLARSANFVSAIDEEIERIREMPFASPPWSYAPRYRARTLRSLPYRLIYEVDEQTIRIVAIAHTSRDPAYWLDRVKRSSTATRAASQSPAA